MNDFYIDDHAVLFALLTKSAEDRSGSKGLEAIERALISYGRERGLRSAMRCQEDGHPLTIRNYFLYGEWVDVRQWSRSATKTLSPEYVTQTLACGWNDTWKKYGLIEYGKIYCRWIDKELLYGFNPDLRLEMASILSCGDACCEFQWKNCRFDGEDQFTELMEERRQLIPRVTKDFLFHCAHLFSTFKRECYRELGLVKGNEILEDALNAYGKIFGAEKSGAIVSESSRDFLSV